MSIDAIYGAIGRFVVKFRWVVVVVWVVGAFAAAHFLPTLASVTQSNNTKFLPSSAPSMHAATLAQPFGTTNLQPVTVVAATSNGAPLTAADNAALTQLSSQFTHVSNIVSVRNLGISANRQAVQLDALAKYSGNPNEDTDIVNAMRAKIAGAHLPAGLQVHLAGDIAIQVDQQKASGSTGNQLQGLTIVFIVVLLLLIFRSLSLALTTLIPPVLAITLAGPLVGLAGEHGLQVSPIAQLLLIVLVLGAGTDYGLFLVFRVREELRGGLKPNDAVVKSVTRVGESITFSAATVIAAVLTLLLASFPFYSNLGVPFAIALGVMLLAGLTLLPALLAIRLQLLGLKRRAFTRLFGKPKLLPWDIQRAGRSGVWGRVA